MIRFHRINQTKPQELDLYRLQREHPQFAEAFLLEEEKLQRQPPASFRPFGQAVMS